MKRLSERQLIELMIGEQPSTESLRAFESVLSTEFLQPGHFARMINEGHLQSARVHFNGAAAFDLAYHLTDDGGLWIDLVQTLHSGAPTSALFESVDLLAKHHAVRYIRFTTPRRGLVELAKNAGYRAESVMVCKEVRL